MKDLFTGFYRKSEDEIKEFWKDGIIVFDTNVLLNLYRYSDNTRNALLNLIGKFSKQIYLPYQAAFEYNKNRCEVIAEQEKAYKEFLEKITQIKKDLQSTNKPPFLTQDVDKELNSAFIKVNAEVEDSLKKYSQYFRKDPIYDILSKLFKDRITERYDDEKLSQIFKSGEERFKLKIPPGFEDEKSKEGNNKYGDLVLWNQVIELAKNLNKSVILITDERKSDWWWKIKDGRTMGPRFELVKEMKDEANVGFHMYSSERFLEYGLNFLEEQVNKEALDEISALKRAEMEEIRRLEIIRRERALRNQAIREEVQQIEKQIEEIDYVIDRMDNDLSQYSDRNLAKYYEGEEMDKELPEHYKILSEHREHYLREREQLSMRRKELRRNYMKNRN